MTSYNKDRLWADTLILIQQIVPRPAFTCWFSETHAERFLNDTLIIAAPDRIVADQLDSQYREFVIDVLRRIMRRPVNVVFREGGQGTLSSFPRSA